MCHRNLPRPETLLDGVLRHARGTLEVPSSRKGNCTPFDAKGADAIGTDAIGADAIGADAIGADAIGANTIGADASKRRSNFI